MVNENKRVVVVHQRRRVFDDYFKVDEAKVTFSKLGDDGQFVRDARFLVFERGDAAAALLHDADRGVVILTEQFRFPTYQKATGWMIEPIAGMINAGETPEQCIRREVMEEVGYRVGNLDVIATFFVSPGGSSERIFLYYASVGTADLVAPDASGIENHQENVQRVEMDADEFTARAVRGEFDDAKMLIAGLWMAARRKM